MESGVRRPLAQILGVQRPAVSGVATTLQQAGLIRYSRGKMVICNCFGLEAACCECHEIVKQEFEYLLKDGVSQKWNDSNRDGNGLEAQIVQQQVNSQLEHLL